MARGRMINQKITQDLRIHQLSDDTSRLAFTWLISFADCEGRTPGDPALLRSLLFPRRDDITANQMGAYIQEWANIGLIIWYEAKGEKWIQFPGFDKNQTGLRKEREPASEIPAPPTEIDGDLPDDSRKIDGDLPDDGGLNRKESKEKKGYARGKSAALGNGKKPPWDRRFELVDHFIQVTGVPRPDTQSDRGRKAAQKCWWGPLDRFWEWCDKDVGRAKVLITQSVKKMRGGRTPLTISTPQSIENVARSVYSEINDGRSPLEGYTYA